MCSLDSRTLTRRPGVAYRQQHLRPTAVRAAPHVSGSDSTEKSVGKNPSSGNDVPSADEVSIPSSVDPEAPANTGGDNSDGSGSSDSSE